MPQSRMLENGASSRVTEENPMPKGKPQKGTTRTLLLACKRAHIDSRESSCPQQGERLSEEVNSSALSKCAKKGGRAREEEMDQLR
ncbi:hypothetical protein REPUB_Repub12eG0022200 [Reevesia pubescens]